jgi:hypothetical protein
MINLRLTDSGRRLFSDAVLISFDRSPSSAFSMSESGGGGPYRPVACLAVEGSSRYRPKSKRQAPRCDEDDTLLNDCR